MPAPTSVEYLKPRSWEDFEDLVADIYCREWRDPHTTRNGRLGQRQNGVDIYGRPQYAGGAYAGVQCKRIEEGTLSSKVIDYEIVQAEGFVPALVEFTIATTDKRDATLQEYVRTLNEKRTKEGKFSVYVSFWEDICAKLADVANRDLIAKHYSGFDQAITTSLAAHSAISLRWQEYMRSVIDEVRHQYVIVAREAVQAGIDKFLISPSRICLVLGRPGTRTLPVLLAEAERLIEQRWAALLIRGAAFTVDHVVELLAPNGIAKDRHSLLVDPWMQPSPSEPIGMLLFVDALQQQDPAVFYRELLTLKDLTATIPFRRFKIVLACDELAWEGLRITFSELRDAGQATSSGDVYLPLIQVGDLEDSELYLALRQIGAEELITPAQSGGALDPHRAVLLELLRNPSIFEVYARLRAANNQGLISGSSRGAIVEAYLGWALDDVHSRCHCGLTQLRAMLVSLAQLLRQAKRRDLRIEVLRIVEHLPSLRADVENPDESPFWAFVAAGLLVVDGPRAIVRFSSDAMHAEFAADMIENEVAGATGEDLNTYVGNLFTQFFEYPPLGDALLSYLDRTVTRTSDDLDRVVEAFLRARWLKISVIFRLTAPMVLESLFRVAKQQKDLLYRCIDAAKSVRQTDKTRDEVLRRLRDRDPQIRQMAAAVAGANQMIDAIGPLLDLASLPRKGKGDVEQWRLVLAAFDALGAIGRDAVDDLVKASGDTSSPIRRRASALDAIRTVGFRDRSVSKVLADCIAQDIPDLTLSALLTAAALRDESVLEYARTSLSSPDPKIVRAAAQLLEELPHVDSEEPLERALKLWSESGDAADTEVFRALRGAVLAIADSSFGRRTLYAQVIHGKWDLSRSIQQDKGIGLEDAYFVVLKDVASRLAGATAEPQIYRELSGLNAVLAPAHLDALAGASHALEAAGIDVVYHLVDAVAEGKEIDPHDALGAALRCQSSTLDREVTRLIMPVKWPYIRDVCEALWIMGFTDAEQPLLNKLQHLPTRDDTLMVEWTAVLKALGTCAGTTGAAVLLDHLRSAEWVELYLAAEGVCPLVRRGVIATDVLIDLANDRTASVFGRTCAIQTLYLLDPHTYQDVFRNLAQPNEDETVLSWAVSFLHSNDDPDAQVRLRHVLTETKSAFAAGKAARSLAEIGNELSVVEIEAVLVDLNETGKLGDAQSNGTSNLIGALEHFANPSSVGLLQTVLKKSHDLYVQAQVVQALGAFPNSPDARTLVREHFSGEGDSALRYQASAAMALSQMDSTYLVQESLRLSNLGALQQNTRRAIANWLPMALNQSDESLPSVHDLAIRLLSDHVFSIREQAANAIYVVDQGCRRRIYSDLWEKGGWDRACAVQASGFWDDFIDEIGSARLDADAAVRRAADGAMELQQRRISARYLLAQLPSDQSQVRLRAYHCVRELGDWQIARELYGLLDTGPSRIHHLLDRLARETAEKFEKHQEARSKAFDGA
jgi:hypothetical protein